MCRPCQADSALPVTLLVVDAGCASLSPCPRWLIRYLVEVGWPSRGSTGTFCHGGVCFHCATSGSTLASMYVNLLPSE
eukprot:4374030-Pyramimonas_sp.AAC.1